MHVHVHALPSIGSVLEVAEYISLVSMIGHDCDQLMRGDDADVHINNEDIHQTESFITAFIVLAVSVFYDV